MAGYGVWQGAAEATGRLPGIALNLAQLQQQGQHMRALEANDERRLALQERTTALAEQTGRLNQEGLEIANRKAKMEADQLADSMKLLPVNETLTKMGITRPAEQKLFLEYAGPYVETGEASGQPVIQKQHAKAIWEKMRGDVDFGIKLGSTRGAEINKEIAALQGKLTNPETAGKIKPEQAQQIQQQIDALVEQRTIADNGVKMLKQKQRAANKEAVKNFFDPASKQWVQKNIVTDDVTGLIPEDVQKKQMEIDAKVPAAANKPYMDARGDVVLVNENDPNAQAVISAKGLKPYDKGNGGLDQFPGNVPQAPATSGERNESALKNLKPGDAAVVKQLAEYKIPLPSGMALRTPYWQGILQRAAMYDPTFDATQYNVRMGVKRDFTSGKSAQNVRSLNTAIGHLESLAKAAEKLNNAPVQLWNTITNYGLTKVAGDPRVTNFNAAATAIEGELANVFKNTGATDQEIKAWRENLSTSFSKSQLKGAIQTVIELIGGRLSALRSQYETGLGKPKDYHFLSDKSLKILKGLGADIDTIDPVSGMSANNTRQPVTTEPADDMSQFWKK